MDAFKSPEDDAFFAAIGRLTISWAHIESGLDAAITVVHSVLGGDKIEPELPRMLQRKLKYLRASCNKIPALASYKASFPIFADAVQSASDIRHNLIHGSISVYPAVPGEERVAEMSRLLWGAQQFTEHRFSITTTEISETRWSGNQTGLTVTLVRQRAGQSSRQVGSGPAARQTRSQARRFPPTH
jgi:hypothetical protein